MPGRAGLSGASAFAEEETHAYPFLGEVTAAQELNIRAGQSTNFEKLGDLKKGDTVIVVDQSYSWYKIKLPQNADSFMSGQFVKVLGEGIGEVTGSRVNIRARPRVDSAVVGQAAQGTLVRLKGDPDEGGWYKIEPIDQSYGWVFGDFIQYVENGVPPARTVSLPTKNIYTKKRQAQVQAVAAPEQAAVPVQKQDKNWVVVQGVISAFGQAAVSPDVRHQIVQDDKKVYYLKGYRRIFDIFLQNKVQVEGVLLPDISASSPVIFVKKVSYIL